ncbi:hypothetical protein EW145_g2273 [Phellinidium pouzarii]|uniref:Uncharacterized protein n=1 Tax=Phellinidium pouzarii TaxID=167371 RepID=A0A4S4LBF4_9AGAM|nr:hypothetical protein EW145_g2273 [Phellinidium pouzarii]
MSGEDIILMWRFPPPQDGHDLRTFNVFLNLGQVMQALHLYKFLTISGVAESVTTFERWNIIARRWEIAGEIHWVNKFNGQVQFGIHTLQLQEIRKRNDQRSKSRGFMAYGSEYKWKIVDEGNDLVCVDSYEQTVANWTQETLELRVVSRSTGTGENGSAEEIKHV